MLHYVIKGNPISLLRPRLGRKRLWDTQKNQKLLSGIELISQHEGKAKFTGALRIDITFYMYISMSKLRHNKKIAGTYHITTPDLDNMIKFILDVCVQTGIMFSDDCIVADIRAKKVYDENPRTEFIIQEIG